MGNAAEATGAALVERNDAEVAAMLIDGDGNDAAVAATLIDGDNDGADVPSAIIDDDDEDTEMDKSVKILESACKHAKAEVMMAERNNTRWKKIQVAQTPRYYFQHTGQLCTYMTKLFALFGIRSSCCDEPLTYKSSGKVEQGLVVRHSFACSGCLQWQRPVGCEELVSSPTLPKVGNGSAGRGEADVNKRGGCATFISGTHVAGWNKQLGEMGVLGASDATTRNGWDGISDVMPALVEECCREARVKMAATDPNRDRYMVAVRETGSGPDGEVGEIYAGAMGCDGAGGKRAMNKNPTGRAAFNCVVCGHEGTDTKPMVVGLQTFCNRCGKCEGALRELKAAGKGKKERVM